MNIRHAALKSEAKVRLITGNPGVGKTYFGCQLAGIELRKSRQRVKPHQKILFLTFARNAVARIRQVYLQQVSDAPHLSETVKGSKISEFHNRVNANTFAGFFWWLVGSYGRYIPGNNGMNRLWFIGKERTGSEIVPENYKGYTFKELENDAALALQIKGIRELISDIYPLIIVDEFQDVDNSLFEVIDLLRENSRLVLLCGPGQCIYRGMKDFDPAAILEKCNTKYLPTTYELMPKDESSQRYCREISDFIAEYDRGPVTLRRKWPIHFKSVERKTRKGYPKELATQVGKHLMEMKAYLTKKVPDRLPSLCVLTSTNQGVSEIYNRFLRGNETYYLNPIRANLHFEDTLLLLYGRLVLSLLNNHWITYNSAEITPGRVAENLSSFFRDLKSVSENRSSWKPLAKKLINIVRKKRKPAGDITAEKTLKKLFDDIETINNLLRATRSNLPDGCPPTPLTKSDIILLRTLSCELLRAIDPAFNVEGMLNLISAERAFEKSIQKRIIFEKIGIESGVQVMTIHKSKGREFDGVILLMEDNRKALWKNDSRSTDTELNDLYRVGISRAKEALGIIGYNDIYDEAKLPIQKLLPTGIFKK